MRSVPFRQIHLDFHTSPFIPDIGSGFDADAFAAMLREARVESINLFAKCHHGMYYYPTKLGTVHPNLSCGDLLGKQLEACRSNGINAFVYTCVGWCEDTAHRHPEWQEVSPEGVLGSRKPFSRPYYTWQKLCLNNPDYRAYMKQELEEIHTLYKPAGFWIDIVFQRQCVCGHCRADMERLGLDPASEADRLRHDRLVQINYMRAFHALLKGMDPALHVYFNGHPYDIDLEDDMRYAAVNKREQNTFVDVESLPSEMWGYAHFPVAVNFINKYPIDITMMNGRFHNAWGDFGSLRNLEALEYECFRALANGAGCCVGDQLHPTGRMDAAVYQRIGDVFRQVEAREPWCRNSRKVAQVGVFGTHRSGEGDAHEPYDDLALEGVYRMLTELHLSFDVLSLRDPLDGYELLILPDDVYLTEDVAERIDRFVVGGGKLMVTGRSGLDRNQDAFLLKSLGVRYVGEAEYQPRYMRLDPAVLPGVPAMVHATYEQGVDVLPEPGSQLLAPVVNPYFNRGEVQFCSHRQTPPRPEDAPHAAVTRNGNAVYLAHAIFTDYAKHRCKVFRDLVDSLMGMLQVKPLVHADVPTHVEVTTRRIPEGLVVHFVNYIVERKSRTIDTVETVVPLMNRRVSIRCDRRPSRVQLYDPVMKGMREIPANWVDGHVNLVLPKLMGHEMVLIEE
jgi:hypothetical protein